MATPIAFASPQGRWVLAATVIGSGMGFLDATVVNVALPTMGRELDADVSGLQWVIDGYLLTLAALILLGGSLGDRLGRRRMFMLGVLAFTGASLLCALAPTVAVLVVARALQGAGAALLTPGSLAILESSFARGDRARAVGAWSGLTGVGAALGPIVGGYLIEVSSWRAIFLLNLPLGAAVLAIASRHVPESRDTEAGEGYDLAGSGLAVLALAATTFLLVEAPRGGVGAGLVVAGAVACVAGWAGFLLVERRSPHPMLPLDIFRSRQFTSANVLTFVVYAALGGVFFFLVVFLQTSLGYSPLAAGAASFPVTVCMLLLSARAGALAQRVGPRVPLTFGPVLLAAGMLVLSRVDPGDGYLTAVLPGVVIFGLGLSSTVAPVTSTVLAAAPERHSGIASGVSNAVSRVAQLLTVAVLPLVVGLSGGDYQDPAAFAAGFHAAMVICAVLALAGSVLAWTTIRADVLEDDPEPPAPAVPAAAPAPSAP